VTDYILIIIFEAGQSCWTIKNQKTVHRTLSVNRFEGQVCEDCEDCKAGNASAGEGATPDRTCWYTLHMITNYAISKRRWKLPGLKKRETITHFTFMVASGCRTEIDSADADESIYAKLVDSEDPTEEARPVIEGNRAARAARRGIQLADHVRRLRIVIC
jgi:hypothetical protein